MFPRIVAILFCLCCASYAPAGVALFNTAAFFNIDNNIDEILDGDLSPAGIDLSSFDHVYGLGTIDIHLSGAGARHVSAFFDHEIDVVSNDYFNEVGDVFGLAEADPHQSWEIDEPGYVFGDIFDNFLSGALDNTNSITFPEDVSMAMGWDFTLAVNDTAIVQFVLSETAPVSGFYLRHHDPDSGKSIYFSSSLNILSSNPNVIPEPASFATWGITACMLSLVSRRRRSRVQ